MGRPKSRGRIRFPGNPWPDGHAVTEFAWTARVERGTGIWFDLHLRTEDYDAADARSRRAPVEEDEPGASDWESRIVWCNYGRCTLSSTFWAGSARGFLVATDREPLDWRKLPGRVFLVDEPPVDVDGAARPAFNVYLTGHDAAGGHRIAFRREAGKRTFAIDWRGRIALAYGGATEYRHEFEASLTGIPFGGIELPNVADRQRAQDLVDPFVADLREFATRSRDGRILMFPK